MKTTMRMLAITSAVVAGGSAAYADGTQQQQQQPMHQQGQQQQQQQGQVQQGQVEQPGAERALQQVFFAFDSDKPIGDLLMVANMLECTPNETIILDGFADPVGSAAYNADLSKRRAVAVRDQLVEFGISGDRILLGAFGEHGATGNAPNQADRRVDIRSSSEPVATLIEARKANAVAIVAPGGQVQQGGQQTARPNTPPVEQPPEG